LDFILSQSVHHYNINCIPLYTLTFTSTGDKYTGYYLYSVFKAATSHMINKMHGQQTLAKPR